MPWNATTQHMFGSSSTLIIFKFHWAPWQSDQYKLNENKLNLFHVILCILFILSSSSSHISDYHTYLFLLRPNWIRLGYFMNISSASTQLSEHHLNINWTWRWGPRWTKTMSDATRSGQLRIHLLRRKANAFSPQFFIRTDGLIEHQSKTNWTSI